MQDNSIEGVCLRVGLIIFVKAFKLPVVRDTVNSLPSLCFSYRLNFIKKKLRSAHLFLYGQSNDKHSDILPILLHTYHRNGAQDDGCNLPLRPDHPFIRLRS